MVPHSRNVEVISVMTVSSVGTTVSNCLQVKMEATPNHTSQSNGEL